MEEFHLLLVNLNKNILLVKIVDVFVNKYILDLLILYKFQFDVHFLFHVENNDRLILILELKYHQ